MTPPAPPEDSPGTRTGTGGRDEEFATWLHVRQGALLRTATLLCGDPHEAQDVLQTALAKLYLSWDRVRERDALDAYVRRALVNETTSLWRRAWRRRERPVDEVPDGATTADRYDLGERAEVWRAVSSLPPRARSVVVLRYYEQLTEAETAEVLGVSVGTVKSQAHRGLALLRERTPAHLDPRTGSVAAGPESHPANQHSNRPEKEEER
ncbi:SigE family RNA polymerase sigma factor [Nocardioides bruguierae]|uniref:SigE family RNA polymerase sigma factor n=1 Tax=Nocardioides bruguierae TaxID=2945102 RepID=A0A9X2D607_9ACTN|nr:SigE family RNA polymerase sigma factor [Nocardioides bruguierae]MCL8025134.1 SigE family RNA polymerase sigma factor [Nocardioides bruguierae]MCM0620052.1 SigE family RNA polymerase sigma factor [Nocardioides bruguierae]